MSKIIQNAMAPIVDIHIKVDFRVNPYDIQLNCSQNMPSPVLQDVFGKCISTVAMMEMQAQSRAAGLKTAPNGETLPDLPPAPKVD